MAHLYYIFSPTAIIAVPVKPKQRANSYNLETGWPSKVTVKMKVYKVLIVISDYAGPPRPSDIAIASNIFPAIISIPETLPIIMLCKSYV